MTLQHPPDMPPKATRRLPAKAHAGAQRSAATQANIFKATEHLLATVALHDLAVADILEEVGISRPTFYYHFKSKYDVVGGLLAMIIDETTSEAQLFIEVSARPEEWAGSPIEVYEAALRTTLHGAARIWHDHRAVLQAISELWPSIPELEALWRDFTGRFITIVAEGIEHLRAVGVATDGAPSRTVAATLAWSTERCLYVAGRTFNADLPSEDAAIEPLIGQWLGAVFGLPSPRAQYPEGD